MAVSVVQGDCIEVMRKWKAESVDAIVCDPPYALEFMGKEWDSFSETSRSAKGHKSTDKWGHAEGGVGAYKSVLPRYNGKQKQSLLPFQQWCEEWGKEALRILKPGGYILAFGGSRTYHRLAAGLEDAGFEIRDSIIWMYGSGFPKSLNVSKAIDKAGGTERAHEKARVLLARAIRAGRENAGLSRAELASWFPEYAAVTANWEREDAGFRVPALRAYDVLCARLGVSPEWRGMVRAEDKTIPVGEAGDRRGDGSVIGLGHSGVLREATTDDARTWEGWGTALKPAHEPIVVGRKATVGTVASNILTYGTGALNIEACRIRTDENLNGGAYSGGARPNSAMGQEGEAGGKNSMLERGGGRLQPDQYQKPSGRWPSNVIFSHTPFCRCVGTRTVTTATGAPDYTLTGVQGATPVTKNVHSGAHFGGEDGQEEMEDWDCPPHCPVRILDEQTADLKSGALREDCYEREDRDNDSIFAGGGQFSHAGYAAEKGGASRFFYCAKASRREREAGLFGDAQIENRTGMAGKGTSDRKRPKILNTHPTVKPIRLMEYLLKLVTPEGGVVLDPFCGSGTTLVAAINLGINCIGIEQSADYVKIAKARIEYAKSNPD